MSSYLFDTCFLIDLEREMKRGGGKAHQFLAGHLDARPCLTWTIAGEFGEGFETMMDPVCAMMLARFEILPMDHETAAQYAIAAKYLRGLNQLIGANDLWIAGAALAYQIPLVSNNASHLSRVPGLSVIGY